MARLDQLIDAMLRHGAEALVLRPGQRPSLLMDGSERPIVKSALTASHVSSLTSEIAPAELRGAIASGGEHAFVYHFAGQAISVETKDGPEALIRVASTAPGETEAAAEAEACAPSEAPAPVSEELEDGTEAAIIHAHGATAAAIEAGDDLSMDTLLRHLVDSGGSDLHLSSDCRPMIRVDGELAEIEGTPTLSPSQADTLLLSIAPERNREEFREIGDTDFAYEIEGLCRFRSNLFKDRKGSGGVFRVIPSDILTADKLNLSQAIRDLCFLTKGLVLVTGPTGSGKSTTLSAMVDHINRNRRDHVITIEDPIEFVHPNRSCLINQREVHLHTQGFKPALRAALREDPDIVLVGEMRDLETVAIAIETAETGHLVFGTLHTSSAVSTVDRIIDQFPADKQEQIRIMLSESLKAVIAQVLCKKIGGGRVAALEVLIVNAAVSNLIREGKTFQIPSIMQTGRAQGNVLLNAALLELVTKKIVEPQEAYLKAIQKRDLLASFERKHVDTSFIAKTDQQKSLQPA